MVPLTAFRSREPGLADLLPWAAVVDPGVVQCKQGGFLTAWYYQGPDIATVGDTDRNLVTRTVNEALRALGSGWAVWTDAIRLPAARYPEAANCHFKSQVAELIDEERRREYLAEGAHYETETVLAVLWTPPTRVRRKAMDIALGRKTAGQSRWPVELLDRFRQMIGEFEERLSVSLAMRKMGRVERADGGWGDELVDYLHFLVSGEAMSLRLPNDGAYLDAVLGAREFTVGGRPAIDNGESRERLAVVAIEGFPSESYPQILERLAQLLWLYRWSTRFIPLGKEEALGELEGYRRAWAQQTMGFAAQVFETRGRRRSDAEGMVGEAEAALGEAESERVRYGYYTAVVVIRDTDPELLQEKAGNVRKLIQSLGFSARVESVNAVEAWLGSLPGHTEPNVRRPLLHSMSVADLIPVSHIWSGRDLNPSEFMEDAPPLLQASAAGRTPFRLHLHVGDVGHTMVFGPTGSGKSTLLAMLAAQWQRYRGARVWAMDRGGSLETITRACGGSVIDLAALADGEGERLAPVADLESPGSREWATEWIGDLFTLQTGRSPTVEQRTLISQAVQLTGDTGGGSMTDLCGSLQDAEVREAIQQYTVKDGNFDVLDGERDTLDAGRISTFEMGDLLETSPQRFAPLLTYVWRRFEQSLDGSPALLLLGESWAMLRHEMFANKIRSWLKTLRKRNCAVVMETQSLADAKRSSIYTDLLESCPTRILLPNGDAEAPGVRELYEGMGLSDVDIATIAAATPKKHYFIASPEGRRLVDLELGNIARAFCAVSDPDSLKRRRELEAEYGDGWAARWMAERNQAAGRKAA